ncbi:MAG TPA: chromosome partitioning protein ParB [Verrucomicrobiales bacterium]|nr:chromosome partitioning protein ParB [Verrucomicrobiales bacterium]
MAKPAKSGLGKGLSALLGDKSKGDDPADAPPPEKAAAPQPILPDGEVNSVKRVDINLVQPCPSQPRKSFDRDALESLAVSITANGIIQPLVVREKNGGQFELIAGERRWRAAQIAKLDTVPVVVREASDAQVLEMALVENLQREDLNPIEEAMGFSLLIEAFGITQEDAAQRIGISRAAVTNSLRLLKLPEEVQAHLRTGQLSVGHAKVILGLDDTAQQELAAERVLKESLTVRETETMVDALAGDAPAPGKGKKANTATREVHVTSLENRLKETLGTKVSLTYREGKGTLNIKYFSDDDLERILKLLGVEM